MAVRFVCLLAAKGSQAMLVVLSVEALLSLHEHNISGMPRNRRLTTNPEPRSETADVYSTLYSVSSKLHDNLRRLTAPVRMHQSTSRYA